MIEQLVFMIHQVRVEFVLCSSNWSWLLEACVCVCVCGDSYLSHSVHGVFFNQCSNLCQEDILLSVQIVSVHTWAVGRAVTRLAKITSWSGSLFCSLSSSFFPLEQDLKD